MTPTTYKSWTMLIIAKSHQEGLPSKRNDIAIMCSGILSTSPVEGVFPSMHQKTFDQQDPTFSPVAFRGRNSYKNFPPQSYFTVKTECTQKRKHCCCCCCCFFLVIYIMTILLVRGWPSPCSEGSYSSCQVALAGRNWFWAGRNWILAGRNWTTSRPKKRRIAWAWEFWFGKRRIAEAGIAATLPPGSSSRSIFGKRPCDRTGRSALWPWLPYTQHTEMRTKKRGHILVKT